MLSDILTFPCQKLCYIHSDLLLGRLTQVNHHIDLAISRNQLVHSNHWLGCVWLNKINLVCENLEFIDVFSV